MITEPVKKICRRCKEETYNLIDGYCHKCFFEVTRQREKEYRERRDKIRERFEKGKQEEKRERAKKRIENEDNSNVR